jgi:hypothetical protein
MSDAVKAERRLSDKNKLGMARSMIASLVFVKCNVCGFEAAATKARLKQKQIPLCPSHPGEGMQ